MQELLDYRIGVVGAGSWGTTLAQMLAEKGFRVTLWVYEKELLEILQSGRCNTWYLPEVELDPGIAFSPDLSETVTGKQLVFWVTPVKVFDDLFHQGLMHTLPDTIHVCASKGIENKTLKTVSQIAGFGGPGLKSCRFAVLSGPSFAAEVSRKMPTAVVVASEEEQSASVVQQVLATPFFRTYTSSDMRGVELGGALKNVIAVAAGISDGLGFGHNTRAALITRGLAEIIRLGTALGADPLTFAGLSGIGDLVLTCTSTLSRNYRVGLKIGQGHTLASILQSMKMVAEGVDTARSADRLAKHGDVEMPITHEISQVLFENKPPLQAVSDLMSRDLKKEKT